MKIAASVFRRALAAAVLLPTTLASAIVAAKESGANHLDFTAEKLGKFSATVLKGEKGWACTIVETSGFADLDSRACDGIVQCAKAMEPKFYGPKADKWVKRDPAGYQSEFSKVFGKCVAESRRPLAVEYAARLKAQN